jgi:hypothetical protein
LSYIGFLLKNASQSNLKVANVTASIVGTGAVTIAGMRSVLGAVATVAAAGPYFATATVSGNTVNVTVYAATTTPAVVASATTPVNILAFGY